MLGILICILVVMCLIGLGYLNYKQINKQAERILQLLRPLCEEKDDQARLNK